MKDQTHILNRAVIFTEIPGNVKLPKDTRLSIKASNVMEHEVTAITPTGQRYEFKSVHINNLVRTPWVDPVIGEVAPAQVVKPTVVVPEPVKEMPHPFMIGDVAPVSDIGKDTLPTMDVTGSSADILKKKVAAAPAVEVSAPPVEAEVEAPAADVVDLEGEGDSVGDIMDAPIDVTGSSNDGTPKAEKKSKKKV